MAVKLNRRARWAVPGGAVAVTAAVIAGLQIPAAQASPDLPAKTPAQLLASLSGDKKVPPMTGTVVETANWAAAFTRLEQAGLPVALAGRTLRLPGVTPAEVREVLSGPAPAWQDGATATAPAYRISIAPATLEERFFELASAARPAQRQPGVPA